MTLKEIKTPADLNGLSLDELEALCAELRKEIIGVTLKNGGHLASNLGAVELTVALHRVFNAPDDKVIFDVGHQCYTHKLLTGRADKFDGLRKFGGISGFVSASESPYDAADSGHAGTALSTAAGYMRAEILSGLSNSIIAVVGDGAFPNGLTQEALNDISTIPHNLLLILNDNEMTISGSVGRVADRLKESGDVFSEYGFRYAGTFDGHNLRELILTLGQLKELDGHVAIRVKTQKGKGYAPAENAPENFHSVGAPSDFFSADLGKVLCSMAAKNDKITVITAAMKKGSGLTDFARRYPDRFFDTGIAEGHAVTMSAALARGGYRPYVAVYSTFLQRAFDQILHDVLPDSLPVTFLVDRSGFVGGDGETHQGVFDISYLSLMPNMTILAPKNTAEFKKMLAWTESFGGTVAIRYPKTAGKNEDASGDVVFGKWDLKPSAPTVAVLTTGAKCYEIGKKTEQIIMKTGIKCHTVNAKFVKPLDKNALVKLSDSLIVTVEDNVLQGGFGQAVSSFFRERGMNAEVINIGVENGFLPAATEDELVGYCRMSPEIIAKRILSYLK
ncbi:MAG: 1-deoxy-D-xylulose-5-phosphate synthase [Clostridiaceae bacterium]|jgi:1-deoxy-D-xylulose-5-phosphate synthase|nr:1-deoxy-D-xylulose-5-phosphate synthase [Clostridiaceae bacterium]